MMRFLRRVPLPRPGPEVLGAVVALLVVLAAMALAAPASAQVRPERTILPPVGLLTMVEELKVSNATPTVGEMATATFKIKNAGARTVLIQDLAVGVRPDPAVDRPPAAAESGRNVVPLPRPRPVLDFPHVRNVKLEPGAEYSYRQSRPFPAEGRFVALAVATTLGRPVPIQGSKPVAFTVQGGSQAGLRVSAPLALSTTTPRVGERVVATFKVSNTGSGPLTIREMSAVVRPAVEPRPTDAATSAVRPPVVAPPRPSPVFGFPPVRNITLPAGGEYQYQQSRGFPLPGAFVTEPAASVGNRPGPIPDGNRVEFTVTRPMPGRLVTVEPLVLTPNNPGTDVAVTARFQVKNTGGQTLTIPEMAVGVRRVNDPRLTPVAVDLDFPSVRDLKLEPGQVYTYEQSRPFSVAGIHVATPKVRIGDRWGTILGARPVTFTVGAPIVRPTPTPLPLDNGATTAVRGR